MEINISILKDFPDIDEMEIHYDRKDAKIVQLISAFRDKFDFHGIFNQEHIQFLTSQNITMFPILSNKMILDRLREKFPAHFPKPNASMTIKEIIQATEEYVNMNTKTTKKRRLIILEDVIYYDLRLGRGIKIIPYNSMTSEKSIEILKKYADHDKPIEVLDSENGVLVFIPDVKDFKLKIDLFAILATFDFPIYDAATLKEAMALYKEKTPKLVIIANLDTNIDAKEFLIELEEYDPYVKKMNYTETPATNRNKEISRIKHHYLAGYKEIIEMLKDNELKESLPEEIKKTILNSIKELESNFSPLQFYEKAFALKQFGRYFNIKMYWNMMLNLKKKNMR